MKYTDAPFTRIPDFRFKIGERSSGGVPEIETPIKGMELEYEVVMIPKKKFFKIKGKNKWNFEPEVGDEGQYNFTLFIIMNMAG